MKIKAYTKIKPVFIQEGSFKNDKGEEIKFYYAVCVSGDQCDKISLRKEVYSDLNNFIGKECFVWIDVDTNSNSKPKIIDVEAPKSK